MKYKINEKSISCLVTEFDANLYKTPSYQRRADAWSNKLKSSLIESIIKKLYIPPLLFSQKNILDGLQRLTAISDFLNNKLCVKIDKKELKFDELEDKIKSKFLNRNLIIIELSSDNDESLSSEEEKDLFIRINRNSIQLNKVELQFANASYRIKNMIFKIVENNINTLKQISRNKKDKRFTYEYLIAWCLCLINYRSNGFLTDTSHTSVRQLTNNAFLLISDQTMDSNHIDTMIKNSKKVIDAIWEIVEDKIYPKAFKVIFSSVFVVFYEHIVSLNCFKKNKSKILNILIEKVFENLKKMQSIGGIHYDSYEFIKDRIAEVSNALKEYFVDHNRILTTDEKNQMYYKELIKEKGVIKCAICKKIIKQWSEINFDHILAHTNGGKTNIDNTQIICKECNLKKSSH